ncbi:MAG: beta-galactosidase, partial [Candidatus Hydrogenedentes bacterium]|nr:beta-galactosidase [Candidatus Hydrogenedentota bacterium]
MRRFRFAAPVLMIALLDTQVALAVEPPSRLFTPEGHGRRGDGYFPDDDVRLITALSDVVTPHIEWAKPIQGGTVRVLAVSHKVDGRWPVELAQRFDFVVTTVYGHAPDSLGAYPERGLFVQGTVDVEARLLQAMNEPIDVIVSNMPLNALGEKVKGRIEELMARHVGYIGPCDGFDRTGWERLDDAAVRMVCDAVPLKGLRLLGGRFASSAAAAGQIMAVWRGPQGQNAVDLSAYPRDGEKPDADRLQFSFLPSVEQEAWCSLMGRAVLWACGRWTSEDAPALALPAQPIDQSGLPLSVPVKPEGVRFQLRIWDEDGRVRKLGDDGVIPRLPAGRYFVGLQAFREDAVARWSLTCLDVAAPVSVAEVVPEKSCVRRDEAVRASVRLSSDPPGGSRLLFEILDNYGRCVFRKEQPAQREAVIEGDARESLHMYNYVNAVLVGADGEAISEKRHAFFIEQPSPPTDDLSMMVWEASASFDPVERQILQRFAGLGANAALRGARNGSMDTTSLEACTMSNVHPIIYVTKLNAPQVGEDGIRQPCITAPDFRELLKSTLARQAQAFAQFSPLAYSLGDDQHYVSPGQDVCWSPSCRARLAAWAQAKYGDLERLNEAWGTTYSSFDDAVPIKSVEALPAARQAPASQYKPLCHWLDHKLFLDTMVADWHREMADAIESTDPGAVAWYDCTVEGWPRPGSGFDFWQLAAKSKFCVNYLNPIVHD